MEKSNAKLLIIVLHKKKSCLIN